MSTAADALREATITVAAALDRARLRGNNDEELLGMVGALEELGRVVDAGRVMTAGEASDRSNKGLGSDALSSRKGCASPAEMLARITGQSERTARARMRLGAATNPRASFHGEVLPAYFPFVGAQLESGLLGVDAATEIVRAFRNVNAQPEAILEAEEYVVAMACGLSYKGQPTTVPDTFEEVKQRAMLMANRLDPDGVLGNEERAMELRNLGKGFDKDGLMHYRLSLLPEFAATLESIMNALQSPRTGVLFLSDEARALAEASDDKRSWGQERHDILASLLDTASRDKDLPKIGGTPPAIVVTVRQQDLLRGPAPGLWTDSISPSACTPRFSGPAPQGSRRLPLLPTGGSSSLVFRIGASRRSSAKRSPCAMVGASSRAAASR